MSSEYINQLESGRLTPSLDFILNFCDYFNISPSEFFDAETKYPIETKKIIEELNNLSQEDVTLILDLLKLVNKKWIEIKKFNIKICWQVSFCLLYYISFWWEFSSAGRASALQAEGHRFEPYNSHHLREWLSGRALPCQGKGREFESRLPLQTKEKQKSVSLFCFIAYKLLTSVVFFDNII